MKLEKSKRRVLLSWLTVGPLFVLCGILGFLQYRWIGEVSVAERERLHESLQASLDRFSMEFNSDIVAACRALLPPGRQPEEQKAEDEVAARYELWKRTTRHERIFRRIAIAIRQNSTAELRSLNLETGVFEKAGWPDAWKAMRDRMEPRPSLAPWEEPGPPTPPGPPPEEEGPILQLPLMMVPLMTAPMPGGPPEAFGPRRRWEVLIVELNVEYLRNTMLPEMLQRYFGRNGSLEYQVEVVSRVNPSTVVYQSDPDLKRPIAGTADASVGLLDVQFDQLFRRRAPPGGMRGGGLRRGPGPDAGRWQMFVRHRSGSLEAVVSQARWRNLAVTAGVLLLMLGSLAALIRYTQRAQRLAELQMDFVAGVSHELRTPLTVIHTAAYNLRSNVTNNPNQVERYGALIQQECGRLTELVEQVLRFAGANAGRAIRERAPVSVETVIEDTIESSKAMLEGAQCVVEKTIEPGLPVILGDAAALKQALRNLVSNAAKYGAGENNWIGLVAVKADGEDQAVVEIRVADRGPGIPNDEQRRVFDPFFRGKRALQDQIHGTGLGLTLVKEIVEAHGGTIAVHSGPGKGTEFVVRIPAAPAEYQDELAHSAD
jgi:signal transduction histidine kinase